MATPFESTPKWFDAEYYLSSKLAQLLEDDPKGGWTRDTMLAALNENGFDNPYDHYLSYGDGEGLSPNPLFSNDQYLAAKAAQLGSTWTVDMVAKAIKDAGLTLMQHYEMYGSVEGLSPSSAFNQDKYFEAKLDQLQLAEPDKGWTMDSLKEAFATNGMTPLDHYLAYAKTEGLDKYDYSDNGAPIPHPGNTKIVLTTGVDSVTPESEDAAFKTSDRDDVISGVVGSSKATLNANDVIDGGAGQDTLTLNMQGSSSTFKDGGVKNVETIVLNNASGHTFDAKGVEGANIYVVNGGEKGNVIIKNVDSLSTGYAIEQTSGTFTAQILDSAVTGKTDTAYVTLNNVGSSKTDVTLTVKGTSSGIVEGVTLYAQGKDNYVALHEGHETVTVKGAANLDVNVIDGLKTFDASEATGKVVADLHLATTLKTVNGGAGDDQISVATAALAGTVFNGGAGKDTLAFTGTPAIGDKPTISGFETIALSASGSYLNGTNVTGVEEVVVNGAGSDIDATIAKLGNTELTLSLNGANAGDIAYEGTGTLTLQSVDTVGTYGDSVTNKVTANAVDTLYVTNNDHNGTAGLLTLTTLEAKSATSMVVDTGEGGVTLSTGTHALGSVETLTVIGKDNFTDVGSGSFAKLTEVDASNLGGNFKYALHTGTASLTGNGLTIKGSLVGDNTITGTTGNDHVKFTGGNATNEFVAAADGGKDTLELGAGSYLINVTTTAAADTANYVKVNGFGTDDVFGFGGAGTALSYTQAAVSIKDSVVYGENKGGVINWESAVNAAYIAALDGAKTTTGRAEIAANAVFYIAIQDADETGIFAVKIGTKVTANSAIASSDITAIDLVGVLQGTTLSDFDASSFIA